MRATTNEDYFFVLERTLSSKADSPLEDNDSNPSDNAITSEDDWIIYSNHSTIMSKVDTVPCNTMNRRACNILQ